jgi:DNA repair protein RadC
MEKNNRTISMKEMPDAEQPYEKCERYGAQYLSDSELIAVILRTGRQGETSTELAKRLLLELPGKSIAGLFQSSFEQLREIKGIGRVKSIQLLCLAEITKRMIRGRMSLEELVCEEPSQIAAYFMPSMRFLETEQVRLLILNGRHSIANNLVISNGSFNAAMASPREVFYYALKHKAVAIILLHNHPSGDPSPSREDLVLTRRIAQTGELIGIPLLDHIIIGDNRYVIVKESGYFSLAQDTK